MFKFFEAITYKASWMVCLGFILFKKMVKKKLMENNGEFLMM